MNMNREILRIALPNIVSNITVPLMGIASTAIAGHWGDDSVAAIGALAIGVSIFNFIYWNCSFVRMGTSGITAQAYGAGDMRQCTAMLVRAVAVSLLLGVAVLLFRGPLGELSLRMMNGNQLVREYFYARIWAVPAGIVLFGFNGWYTGMQNAVIPMCIAVTVNIIHILGSLWFAFGCDMGIVGIAYGSVVAQYTGVALAALLLAVRYGRMLTRVTMREVCDTAVLRRFFAICRDIMLRTLCIVAVYTFFTAASARMEDAMLLAVNTLLMQLFTIFSYMNDGFAYAAEALTGRFIGARQSDSLRRCIRGCLAWCMAVSARVVGIYLVWWRELLGLFVADGGGAEGVADTAAAIVAAAGRYIWWIVIIPLAASVPFLMDGIMVGATQTRIMRDSMFWSTAAYFAIYYALRPVVGNDALWCAFTMYMFLRGVLQYWMSGRLRKIYDKAN